MPSLFSLSKIQSHLSGIPVPLAGLALGIVSLGQCLNDVFECEGMPRIICACISSVLFVLVLLRFLFNPALLAKEFEHPVIGAIVPTFAMTAMILSRFYFQWFPTISLAVWYIAVIFHLICLIIFLFEWIKRFQNKDMIPAWFIPPVGIMVAAVSYPTTECLWVAKLSIFIGVGSLLIVVPLLIWRLFRYPQILPAAQPTIAILAAPASLTLAGYISVSQQPLMIICASLLPVAIVMTFVIYAMFFRLLRLPFSPGFAAFTFPLTIGVTALFKMSLIMKESNIYPQWISGIHYLAVFEALIATGIISYVSLRYTLKFLKYIND